MEDDGESRKENEFNKIEIPEDLIEKHPSESLSVLDKAMDAVGDNFKLIL